LQPVWEESKRKSRLYKDADWEKIRAEVKASLDDVDIDQLIGVCSILDQEAEILVDKITRFSREACRG
jgi:hypothetical protein